MLALVYGLLVAPVATGFADRRTERDQLAGDLARNHRLLDTRSRWTGERALQRSDAARYTIRATDAASAVEIASRQVKTVVAASGGTIRAIREQTAPSGTVRLRVEMRLGLTQLSATIKDIENSSPYPIIEALAVTVDPASSAGRLIPMEVRVDLAFYYANPAR